MKLKYIIQNKPSGIADTINLSEKFLGKSNFCLMLGDNFFYENFSGHLADCQKSKNKFKLFTYNVKNLTNLEF